MLARRVLAAAFASLGIATTAVAQAVVLEVFKSDVEEMADFEPTGIALEYQTRPLGAWGKLSYGLGLRASFDDGESAWVGGGLFAEYPLADLWLAEGSIMPGYYDPGSMDFDLGGDLEIHSSIGIGRKLGETTRLSLVLSHLSNAGTSDRNPGRNALALRLRHGF